MGAVVLVHQWKFDGTLNDSSGSGNTGSLSSGTASYVPGKFGQQAISLTDRQSVLDTTASNLPTGANDSWSMNLWVKPTTLASLSYLAGWGSIGGVTGTSRGFLNYRRSSDTPNTPGLYFWGSNADAESSSVQTYGTDDFHMITATYEVVASKPRITLYYDGLQKYQGNWNGEGLQGDQLLAGAAAQVRVNSAGLFNAAVAGAYQEYTIWSGVLTGAQVSNLYGGNTLVPEPGTLTLLGSGLLALSACAWRRRKPT